LLLVGLDLGLALFPLQPSDLVAQTLILRLRRPQIGGYVFQQVEQPDDELSGPFVFDAAQIKVVKYCYCIPSLSGLDDARVEASPV
jgi:hypothetical protein